MTRFAGLFTALALLLTSVNMSFIKSKKPQPAPKPVPIYTQLRTQILTLKPNEVGITRSLKIPNVWGVLMETSHPKATVLLISLADGTTSLYFGNGGGIIGGGQHLAVAKVSQSLVSHSEEYFKRMTPTTSFSLPAVGSVKFYILTFNGAFTADINENELATRQHDLSPLFFSGQAVITQLRLHSEQRK